MRGYARPATPAHDYQAHRVLVDAGPDAPAVGAHATLRGEYRFIPQPKAPRPGICWSCGVAAQCVLAPLCGECARLVWGDEAVRPQVLPAAPARPQGTNYARRSARGVA